MKIPAEFAPKSWKMPPGAHIIEDSASIVAREFDGEKLDWLVALVQIPTLEKPILWMRPMDTRFDAGFVTYESFVHLPLSIHARIEPFALRASLLNVWKRSRLARLFCLNENMLLRSGDEAAYDSVLVANDGIGSWSALTKLDTLAKHQDRSSNLFEWQTPLTNVEMLRLPALKLWEHLQTLLADSNSDIVFARGFSQLEERERYMQVFGPEHGDKKEVTNLLRTLLLAQDIWEQIPEEAHARLTSYSLGNMQLFWDDGSWDEPVIEHSTLAEDVENLRKWFFPIKQDAAEHLCVKQWLQYFSPTLEAISDRPTTHEQLEAKLR